MDVVLCSCQDSSHKHEDLCHIFTENLSIVENNSHYQSNFSAFSDEMPYYILHSDSKQ